MNLKNFLACAALAGVSLLLSPGVQADEWNKKTIVSFSAPVEIPGRALPAGDYVFKLMDSQSNRHIVQVWNKDENQLITTIMAFSAERLEPKGKSEFTFYETRNGAPPALKDWFYPGNLIGQEFAYPRTRATEIATMTALKVPIEPSGDSSEKEYATATQTSSNSGAAQTGVLSAQDRPPEALPPTGPDSTKRDEYPNKSSYQTTNQTPDTNKSADTSHVADTDRSADTNRDRTVAADQSSNQSNRDQMAASNQSSSSLPRTGSNDPVVLLLGCASLVAGLLTRAFTGRRVLNN